MKLLGYAAQNTTLGTGASRTCRLRNASAPRLNELIASNLDDLERIINWNIAHRIFLYRLSSGVVPYASHPVNKLSWWKTFADRFQKIGELIKDSGMLVSMHPGQYTVLSSPDPQIVARSISEIEYHNRVFDLLGLGNEAKINIHVGGKYNDEKTSVRRWENNFRKLSAGARARLTIENDGVIYGVKTCLQIHESVGVPVVFDTHHFDIGEGAGRLATEGETKISALKKSLATWTGQPVKPEIHFSTQDPAKKRPAHSQTIDAAEFLEFYKKTAALDFNIMLETKDKELSVLKLQELLKSKELGRARLL